MNNITFSPTTTATTTTTTTTTNSITGATTNSNSSPCRLLKGRFFHRRPLIPFSYCPTGSFLYICRNTTTNPFSKDSVRSFRLKRLHLNKRSSLFPHGTIADCTLFPKFNSSRSTTTCSVLNAVIMQE